VTVVHHAPLLGSTCGGSKGSLGSKIGEQWRRLLPELMASFNCGENQRKTACDDRGYGSRVKCFVGQNPGDLRCYL
jgi:hypothetical protein